MLSKVLENFQIAWPPTNLFQGGESDPGSAKNAKPSLGVREPGRDRTSAVQTGTGQDVCGTNRDGTGCPRYKPGRDSVSAVQTRTRQDVSSRCKLRPNPTRGVHSRHGTRRVLRVTPGGRAWSRPITYNLFWCPFCTRFGTRWDESFRVAVRLGAEVVPNPKPQTLNPQAHLSRPPQTMTLEPSTPRISSSSYSRA